MRVVIYQTKCRRNLLIDYPCLNKYKDNYYAESHKGIFWRENCIVAEMDENEFWDLIKQLMEKEDVIIGRPCERDKRDFELDFEVEIYDDYRE